MGYAYKHSWQYNGVAPFEDIQKWCCNTFEYSGWYWQHETFYFVHDKDYTVFLLRWS